MAGEGRYEFKVITDWSQPERAIEEYVAHALGAINRIKSEVAAGTLTPEGATGQLREIAVGARGSIATGTGAGVDPRLLQKLNAAANGAAAAFENIYKSVLPAGATTTEALNRFNRSVDEAARAEVRNTAKRAAAAQAAAEKEAATASIKAEIAVREAAAASTAAEKLRAKEAAAVDKVAAAKQKEADREAEKARKEAERLAERERKAAEKLAEAKKERARKDAGAEEAARKRRLEAESRRNKIDLEAVSDPSSPFYAQRVEGVNVRGEKRRATRTEVSREKLEHLDEEAAVRQRELIVIQEQRIKVAQATLRNEENLRELTAKAAVLEKQATVAQAKENQLELQRAVARGEFARGTFSQRSQAYIASRKSGQLHVPEEYQRGGQFFGGKFLTTAGFFASSALLYGMVQGVRDTVKQAIGLQKELAIIESQFKTIGDIGGASFGQIRNEINKISKETATAADVVANVTRQLAGAFSDVKTGDPNYSRAVVEARSAFQLAQVTGLPTQQITDDLTAISLAFDTTFRKISDIALGLETEFGVLSPEIVRFTADLAPLGAQLGFTVEQLAALGAAAQQASGKPGSALSEQLGRILPALQDKQVEVITLLGQNADTADRIAATAAAFGEGNIPEVLRQIVGASEEFTSSQVNALASIVGSRREAGTFYALLDRGAVTLRALNTETGAYSGTLDKRFQQVQETVSFRFQELRRALEQFGITLFTSGIGDALADMARSMTLVAGGVSILLRLLGSLNDLMGGLPAKILLVLVAMRGLSNASTALQGIFGGGGFVRNVLLARGGTAAATGSGGKTPILGVQNIAGAIATAISLTLVAKVLQWRDSMQEANKSFDDQVQAALDRGDTPDQIRAAIASTDYKLSGGDRARAMGRNYFTFNNTDISDAMERANRVIARNQVDRYKQILKFLVDQGNEGLEGLDPSDSGVQAELDRILAEMSSPITTGPQTRAHPLLDDNGKKISGVLEANREAVKALVDELDQDAAESSQVKSIADKLGSGEFQTQVAGALRGYAENKITLGELLAILRTQRDGFQESADIVQKQGGDNSLFVEALRESQGIIRETLLAAVQSQQDLTNFIGDLTGQSSIDVPYQAAITAYDTLAAAPEATSDDRFEAAKKIAEAQKAAFEARVGEAESDIEKLRILNEGFDVDVRVRAAVVEQQLLAGANAALIKSTSDATGVNIDLIRNAVVNAIVNLGQEATQILEDLLNARLTIIHQAQAAVRPLANLPGFLGGDFFKEQLADLNREAGSIINQRNSLGEIVVVDPVRGGASPEEIRAAGRAAAEEAADAMREAQDIILAELEYAQAVAEAAGDPVRAAQIGLQIADHEIANAEGRAAELRAMAGKIRAEQSLRQAQIQMIDAWADLGKAMRDAAGDTVGSAQIELDRISQLLADARARGDALGALQLEAQQVRARAALKDARLEQQQHDIDFALQMEHITTQEAIARFRALLQIPGITQRETEEILLKIKELQGQLGQDYKYNLPDFILPTIYEARRADQAGGISSYQDNRVFNIDITANNSLDAQEALEVITEAITAPPRTGNRPRLY